MHIYIETRDVDLAKSEMKRTKENFEGTRF